MQIRSCRWVEFRHISLQPGYATKVEIIDAGVENQSKPDAQHPALPQRLVGDKGSPLMALS
jgi:hypothetical protein